MIYYIIKEGFKSDFHKNGSKSPRGLGLVRTILLSAIFCSVKIVTLILFQCQKYICRSSMQIWNIHKNSFLVKLYKVLPDVSIFTTINFQ